VEHVSPFKRHGLLLARWLSPWQNSSLSVRYQSNILNVEWLLPEGFRAAIRNIMMMLVNLGNRGSFPVNGKRNTTAIGEDDLHDRPTKTKDQADR
jgi:hypothetical protein